MSNDHVAEPFRSLIAPMEPPAAGETPRTDAAPIILVRTNTNATLDEAFLRGGEFHLEQMSATHWWMCLELGQQRVHINLHSKATIKAVMEDDGEVKLLTDANAVSDGPKERDKP